MSIQNYKLIDTINVLGVPVTTFPHGIGDVFESLMRLLPDGSQRSYYGISNMEDDHISYIAAAEEKNENEAKIYRCNRYVIESGKYLTIHVNEWRKKTDSIKDVFHELMQDPRTDKSKPCIEWYKNDEVMLCMMQVDKTQRL
ncbi:MAG TPA: hypothetical protein VIT44_12505 [Cyclobacteriaceae bacterium]